MQNQVDQIKKDQAQIIENEKKKAADEARKDSEEKIKILTEEKANAEKGLTFNEEMISFKFIVDSFQKDFESAIKALNNIKKNDPNKAENLRAGLKIVLAELDKSI